MSRRGVETQGLTVNAKVVSLIPPRGSDLFALPRSGNKRNVEFSH